MTIDNEKQQNAIDQTEQSAESGLRGAPWGWQESLEAKAKEVGVDFDNMIECFRLGMQDSEIASTLHVSEETIFHLRNHFEKYGIDSMVGWD